MSKKVMLVFTISIFILIFVASWGLAADPGLPVINVAYHPNLNGAPTIAIGESKGFFKAEGIIVKPVRFTAGPPEMAALSAGDLDIGFLGAGASFLAMQGNATILTIDDMPIADGILAWPDSKIKQPRDLKGHTIAYTQGTSSEMILLLALKEANLTKSQVNLQPMSPEAATTAFQAHRVDAICTFVPYVSQITTAIPKVVTVRTIKFYYKNFVAPNIWIANKNFLATKRDLAIKFLRAWMKANDYRARHLEEAAVITSKFADVPVAVLKSSMNTTQWLKSSEVVKMTKDGTVDHWMVSLGNMFVNMGLLPKVVPTEQYFDKSLLLEAAGK